MNDEILRQLRRESTHSEPMIVTSLRMPSDLDHEIMEFAKQHSLKYAVVLRRAIIEGWKVLNE